MTLPLVSVADDARIFRIVLDSPANQNALSRQLLVELHEAICAAASSSARVIVLTHAGPTFCSGLDLKETSAGALDLGPLADVIEALGGTRQPVMAIIDGAVRAGGMGVMAACDLVVVAETVNFAFSEVMIGVVPAIISAPVFRRVAPGRLTRFYLTGEIFTAAEAQDLGLVDVVGGDVRAASAVLVERLLKAGPRALELTLAMLRDALRGERTELRDLQRLSETVFASAEAREGMTAFLNKRLPSWRLGT